MKSSPDLKKDNKKMVYVWTTVLTLLLCTGSQTVSSQSIDSLQSFLNDFCRLQSPNRGCNGGVTPTGPVIPPATVNPPATNPNVGCGVNQKRCPQLNNICVSNDIDCNANNPGVTCRVPQDYGVETEDLICGDGKPLGVRCGTDLLVPQLTILLVQCQGSNEVDPRPVTSFSVLNGPGDDGGAGIYQCSARGIWQPKYQSPFINQLLVSCRNAGCGRVPQPRYNMPIHRRWAWVRAIYKNNRLHCTATLVSPNAVVTAAHCLTRSAVDNRPDPNMDNYRLELPGPNFNTKTIKVLPDKFFIHPRYRYNNGNHHHDVAVVFFNFNVNYNLPTVCITDRPYSSNQGRAQVVFSMQDAPRFSQSTDPYWDYLEASWDPSCITTSTRVGTGCIDVLKVQQSQFCASHTGMSMTPGSSGGPYLAEVGDGVEEVWVLMGVLSGFSNSSSCLRDHSIFGQVTDDSRWMKDCIFDNKCSFTN